MTPARRLLGFAIFAWCGAIAYACSLNPQPLPPSGESAESDAGNANSGVGTSSGGAASGGGTASSGGAFGIGSSSGAVAVAADAAASDAGAAGVPPDATIDAASPGPDGASWLGDAAGLDATDAVEPGDARQDAVSPLDDGGTDSAVDGTLVDCPNGGDATATEAGE